MALNITTNYVGREANGYISQALLENRTLDNEWISVLPNVKYKAHLRKFDVSDILKTRTDAFSDNGTANRTDKVLTLEDLEVNSQLPIYDFEQDWQARQMRSGAMNTNLAANFQDFVIDRYTRQVADEIEQVIWNGDTTGSGFLSVMDGLDKKLSGSGSTISKTITSATSKSNVISQLDAVYKDIPDEVYRKGDVAIFVPFSTGKFYRQAVAGQSNEAYYGAIDRQLSYIDVPIYEVPLPSTTYVAGQSSNMFFGTDLINDFSEISLIDMRETTGDDYLRMIMKFKAGVEVANEDEVVYHSN